MVAILRQHEDHRPGARRSAGEQSAAFLAHYRQAYENEMSLPNTGPSASDSVASSNHTSIFSTALTSNSSMTESTPSEGNQWPQDDMSIDKSLSHLRPGAGAATSAVCDDEESSSPKDLSLGEIVRKSGNVEEAETLGPDCEVFMKARSSTAIGNAVIEDGHPSSDEKEDVDPHSNGTSQSGNMGMSNYDNMPEAPGESKNAYTQASNLSPSQNSPQSESEHSSDSEIGLLTRDERRDILLERLMAYFFELLSSCASPVSVTTTETPMVLTARNLRHKTEDDCAPPSLPTPRFLDQSLDREAPLIMTHRQRVPQGYQPGASSSKYDDSDDSSMQDDTKSTAGQSSTSAGTTASENRKSNASYQSTGPTPKRDRENEEDDNKDGRKLDKRTRMNEGKNTTPKRLACPYFKKDHEHPRLARSCSGPGWFTVHRMKEHLDRNHALPPSCVRCYTAFETEADRDAHMRSQDQCQLRERPGRMHGFDAAQKEQLRIRPKGYKGMNETQKWCHIYMILFPETASTDIPSPYYEFVSLGDSAIIELQSFLRHEMADRVRHQLELRIDEGLNPLEEALRAQIVDIVRNVQLELFEEYRALSRLTRPNGNSVREGAAIEIDDNPDDGRDEEREETDAQDPSLASTSTEPPDHFILDQSSWEDVLEALRQAPPLDSPPADLLDFERTLFEWSIPAAQDSTNGTGSMLQEETEKDESTRNETGI